MSTCFTELHSLSSAESVYKKEGFLMRSFYSNYFSCSYFIRCVVNVKRVHLLLHLPWGLLRGILRSDSCYFFPPSSFATSQALFYTRFSVGPWFRSERAAPFVPKCCSPLSHIYWNIYVAVIYILCGVL